MTGPATPRGRGWRPRLFLLVCAPVVVDVLFGAIQLSSIVALVPTVLTYGCAALLIRGLARRGGAGWPTIIVWGLAFVVLAECLIVQTSLAPEDHPGWGRALGVNWTYLVWALGYMSGWGIALSIALTELVFPAHRSQAWLTGRGLLLVAGVFIAGSGSTWYNWTHIVAPRLLGQPIYHPPPITLAVAAVVAGVLIATGWHLTRRPGRPGVAPAQRVPPPAGVAQAVFVAAGLWFFLLLPGMSATVITRIPAAVAVGLAVIVAAAVLLLVHRWSMSPSWSDRHRIALITGALTASMAAGFLTNHFATSMDLVGKIALNAAALGGLGLLYHRRRQHRFAPYVSSANHNDRQRETS